MRVSLEITLFVLIAGCGQDDLTTPVGGTVTLDGRALAECNVVFVPTGIEGQTATGRTNDTGHFETRAKAAEYVLLFNLMAEGGAGDTGLKAELTRGGRDLRTLPVQYGDATKTPWKVRVPVDAPLKLDLRSR